MADNNKIYYTSKYSGEDIDKALEYYYGIQNLNWLIPKRDENGEIEKDENGNIVYTISPEGMVTQFNEIDEKLRQIVAWINNDPDVKNLSNEEIFKEIDGTSWYERDKFFIDMNTNNRWVGTKDAEINDHGTQIAKNITDIENLNKNFLIDGSSAAATDNDGIVSKNTKNINVNKDSIAGIKTDIDDIKEDIGTVIEEEEDEIIHKYGKEGTIYGLLYDTKVVEKDENENDITVVKDGILTNIDSVLTRLDKIDDAQIENSLAQVSKEHTKILDKHDESIQNLQNHMAVIDGGTVQKEDGTSETVEGFLNREKFKQIPTNDDNVEKEGSFFCFDWMDTDRESLYSILFTFDQAIANISAAMGDAERLNVNTTNIIQEE